MNDRDSAELLTRYALDRDEEAFAQLLRRYAGLVHGTALRISGGRADLAEEAAQAVFVQLAQKARRLLPRPRLGGWLHKVTCTTTLGLLRAEKRRLLRESTAHSHRNSEAMPADDASWQELAPHLDGCLRSLGDADREVLTGRYLEGKSTREIAAELQLTPEAVQKRITRALDRLRQRLGRRGILLSASAFSAAFSKRTEATVPDALVHQWTTHALSAETIVGAGGALPQALQSIRLAPWAFLAGGTAVVVLGWVVPAAVRRAINVASVSSAVASGRVATTPPQPGGIPRVAETDDPFRAMVAAARELEPLAREWRLDAAFVSITPEMAHGFILRGEAEFDSPLQGTLFPKLFAKWAEAEPAAAMDYALSSGIDSRLAGSTMGFVYSLVWKWIERDRKAVGDWLVRHWSDGDFHRGTLQGGMGGELASALATSWTREGNVGAALDFLERLPAGPNRDAALAGVADDGSGRARADWPADRQAELMTALAARVDGPLGTHPLRRSVALWAKYHADEARHWIDGVRDPISRFAGELAWLSIARESILVSEDTESGRSRYTSRPVTDRAQRADRALEAASHLPAEAAMESIVEHWADFPAAFGWLKALKPRFPNGEADRAFVKAAVGSLPTFSSSSREASDLQKAQNAFRMCEEISDPDLREGTISGLVRRWIEVSPQQAGNFLANADWPAERLDRLRPLVTNPGSLSQ